MKHFPGPWHIEGDFKSEPSVAIIAADDRGVCRIYARGENWTEEEIANVRAIATLPELEMVAAGASHALRSYQYGNSSPELAKEIADALDVVISILEKGTL